MAEEPLDLRIDLANKKFLLKQGKLPEADHETLKAEVLGVIKRESLLPIYKKFCKDLEWELDDTLVTEMQQVIDAKLAELDAKTKDAEENLGETEIRDALLGKANFLSQIGDKDAAVEAFKIVSQKAIGVGAKIDMALNQIRLFTFYGDLSGTRELLRQAKRLCEEGGDWERKNKLKVYEAVFAASTRDFRLAAELFLDAVTTFTTTELFPYKRVIFHAVLTGVLTLDRPSLKKRVVESPEVLAALDQVPHLAPLLRSLYHCEYGLFFQSLVGVAEEMRRDLFLHAHVRHYLREMRAVAYAQFLESYKSVTLGSMASAFAVSPEFLDGELSRLIAAGRVSAKIDRVARVIETNRPDVRTSHFQQLLRQGDALLGRVQRLAGVIHLE